MVNRPIIDLGTTCNQWHNGPVLLVSNQYGKKFKAAGDGRGVYGSFNLKDKELFYKEFR